MAFAYRHPDMPRQVLIRLGQALPPTENMTVSLVVATCAYKLRAIRAEESLLVVANGYSTLEDILLRSVDNSIICILVSDNDTDTQLLLEPLTFHLSFFQQFFDFARNTDIYTVPGHYSRPGSLAIFTHVYNDNSMLKVWEKFYARIVPAKDLYVIDHGSTSDPKAVLSSDVNVISVPRGPVDHRAISQFCATFQRFLLAQYRWVIHVDADELLLHARGWDYFKDNLLSRQDGVIIKAGNGYDLVHDTVCEAELNLSVPISLQRNRLVSAPIYGKPAVTSVPATWHVGFHLVFETNALVEDPELWLIHLSYMDLGLHLEKTQKWGGLDVAGTERNESPLLYARPSATADAAREVFASMLRDGPTIAVPDWMRGMF
jgi:hypothetical protein